MMDMDDVMIDYIRCLYLKCRSKYLKWGTTTVAESDGNRQM